MKFLLHKSKTLLFLHLNGFKTWSHNFIFLSWKGLKCSSVQHIDEVSDWQLCDVSHRIQQNIRGFTKNAFFNWCNTDHKLFFSICRLIFYLIQNRLLYSDHRNTLLIPERETVLCHSCVKSKSTLLSHSPSTVTWTPSSPSCISLDIYLQCWGWL